MDKKDNNIDSPSSDLKQEAKLTTKNQSAEEIAEPTNNIQPEEQGEIEQQAQPDAQSPETEKPKKKKKGLFITLLILFVLVAGTAIFITIYSFKDNNQYSVQDGGDKDEKEKEEKVELSEVAIKGNDLDDFDLFFLKTEDDNKNIVYSPLSIKYALTMLNEGAAGESKKQIENVLGAYYFKPYTNSANLSLANSLFVNSSKKDKIKQDYISSLNKNFNAELIFDDFASPDNINTWVSDKTFGLVKDILKTDDLDPFVDYFALVNALAIDMDWINEIQLSFKTAQEQGIDIPFRVHFEHEQNTYAGVGFYHEDSSPTIVFSNGEKYNASNISAIANKYDIIKELGEDGIRSKVQEEYESWSERSKNVCTEEQIRENAPDLDEYVNTLSKHYGYFGSSTDFEFYDDNDLKAFAKDLKTYDGITLQYVGIMPKTKELNDFIKTTSAKELNNIIKDLRKLELDSFKEGVITRIVGGIPHFNFDYDLNLKDDLESLGIKDVFSNIDADLSDITDDSGIGKQDPNKNVFVKKALHKANIAFSNSGIKAGAATVILGGGKGAGGDCVNFNYDFEVPIEEIDLSFNKPYLFLIRDKDSGEIWFAGSVYQPSPAVIKEP